MQLKFLHEWRRSYKYRNKFQEGFGVAFRPEYQDQVLELIEWR